jgi:hypothetical protein
MPAPRALQFEDDLTRLHLVHQIGETAITSPASNLKLEHRCHRLVLRVFGQQHAPTGEGLTSATAG